jgi:phosphonate transport system substrate-binding protein
MTMRRKVFVQGWGALALLVAFTARAELVLGVHPFKPATKLTEAFAPLVTHLGEQMGEAVTLRIAKDYQAHSDAIGRDELDVAYLGPAPYIALVEKYGRKPLLVRQAIAGKPSFHGIIFVRRDSAIRALTDLKGKRFAFGERHSTMSHLVPRYLLWQAGITVEQLAGHKFVGDHVNVALAVLAGDFDGGAVKEDVYLGYEGRGLRAIATSAPISDHLFVASRRLPQATVQRLRTLLLQLHQAPKGPEILQTLTRGVTALVPVADSDYDSLRVVLRQMRALGVEP